MPTKDVVVAAVVAVSPETHSTMQAHAFYYNLIVVLSKIV